MQLTFFTFLLKFIEMLRSCQKCKKNWGWKETELSKDEMFAYSNNARQNI